MAVHVSGEDDVQPLGRAPARDGAEAAMSTEVVKRSELMDILRRLELSGACSATHLDPSEREWTIQEFIAVAAYLSRLNAATQWWIADLLIAAEARWGEAFAQVADAVDRSPRTVLNWTWVARKIPPSRRREGVGFTLHALVAALEPKEQTLWLERAEEQRWTAAELQEQLRATPAIPVNGNESEEKEDCDLVLDELVMHIRERLAACGFEREAVLEVAGDVAILRPFPGSELIIQPGVGK
jgi:hypothetical protein